MLRAHVLGGPDRQSDFGRELAGARRVRVGVAAGARDPEVGEHCVAIGEQDVLRLHVAMHEALPMREVEAGAHLLCDAERVLYGQRPALEQPLAQRAAGHVWLDVVQHPGGFARVDEWDDVWVGKLCGDADLAQEPRRAERRGDLRPQDFDGNFTAVLFLVGEIHGRHAAASQLTLDRVAIGECNGDWRTGWLRSDHGAELSPSAVLHHPSGPAPATTATHDGDAHVGDVERPEPDVANTHVDEVWRFPHHASPNTRSR